MGRRGIGGGVDSGRLMGAGREGRVHHVFVCLDTVLLCKYVCACVCVVVSERVSERVRE